MRKLVIAGIAVAALAAALAGWAPWASSSGGSGDEPVLDPANFSSVIDNPYFPLPVGRTLLYQGIKDGQTQEDRVTVTNQTKLVAEGIMARVVTDVATHNGNLLEKTSDWYAQDKQGNVWYLGEDTAAYLPGGKVDRSGSWQAGVHDAKPGIIMRAHPQVPNAYRQEYQPGNAEDTAWIVDRGGSFKLPFAVVHDVLTSLEFTRLEPAVIDKKVYAPGLGIVVERAVTGPREVARLVSVRG